jgi:sialic acid synthase SpsE
MVKFIAEVSSNHSRDIERAIEFIDVAAKLVVMQLSFNYLKLINYLHQKF